MKIKIGDAAPEFTLPFTLLADDKKELVKIYGVWGEKNFMGRDYMGTIRTSFGVKFQRSVL